MLQVVKGYEESENIVGIIIIFKTHMSTIIILVIINIIYGTLSMYSTLLQSPTGSSIAFEAHLAGLIPSSICAKSARVLEMTWFWSRLRFPMDSREAMAPGLWESPPKLIGTSPTIVQMNLY